jgi:hypothetical protein
VRTVAPRSTNRLVLLDREVELPSLAGHQARSGAAAARRRLDSPEHDTEGAVTGDESNAPELAGAGDPSSRVDDAFARCVTAALLLFLLLLPTGLIEWAVQLLCVGVLR